MQAPMPKFRAQKGFTLVELLVVIAIGLIVTGLAIPITRNALGNIHLRGSGTDYANLLQEARISAIKDNRLYSVRMDTTATPNFAYIDVLPKNADGTSGSGSFTVGDPELLLAANVVQVPISSTPDAGTGLQTQVSGAGGAALTDTYANATPVTFTARGLPCTPVSSPTTACSTAATAIFTAFVSCFQSNVTQQFEAVTVTPAGRVQTWVYNNGAWSKL